MRDKQDVMAETLQALTTKLVDFVVDNEDDPESQVQWFVQTAAGILAVSTLAGIGPDEKFYLSDALSVLEKNYLSAYKISYKSVLDGLEELETTEE